MDAQVAATPFYFAAPAERRRVKLPFIDRIWRVRGALPLEAPLSPAEAFDRLDDLFRAEGTTREIDGDTLTFAKKDPLAQDRMAIYDRGTLRVAPAEGGAELRYDMHSPSLLFCFALPFLFLAIAWLLKESRNPAFVFAGIFATLYVAGRILEPRLIRAAFRKRLADEDAAAETSAG
ncbi:hypothetical protein [Novosphingobium resinovorum]|uniref:hypothetical protein n=1 Tax=Novosphingobium resinovorum TaxID=158500 RepID=UPI002ECFED9A